MRLIQQPRQTKVGQVQTVQGCGGRRAGGSAEQEVMRFDVAMNDTLTMGAVEGIRNLSDEAREDAEVLRRPLGERRFGLRMRRDRLDARRCGLRWLRGLRRPLG